MDEQEFEWLDWHEAYDLTLRLCEKVQKDGFTPSWIVGVSRGGLVPARIASDYFGTSAQITIVKVEFYDDIAKTRDTPILREGLQTDVSREKVLLVDDIVDTGKSLSLVYTLLKDRGALEVKVLTLYKKPWSIIDPDYCAKETKAWVIFPWEALETMDLLYCKAKNEGKNDDTIKIDLLSTGMPENLVDFFLKKRQKSYR